MLVRAPRQRLSKCVHVALAPSAASHHNVDQVSKARLLGQLQRALALPRAQRHTCTTDVSAHGTADEPGGECHL